MNEESINKANELLIKILDEVEKGGEFALEKAPELVAQLLMWEAFSSFIVWALSAAYIFIFCQALRRLKASSKSLFDNESNIPVVVFGGLGQLIATALLLCSTAWLKILMAPELFLLEYAANLVK